MRRRKIYKVVSSVSANSHAMRWRSSWLLQRRKGGGRGRNITDIFRLVGRRQGKQVRRGSNGWSHSLTRLPSTPFAFLFYYPLYVGCSVLDIEQFQRFPRWIIGTVSLFRSMQIIERGKRSIKSVLFIMIS